MAEGSIKAPAADSRRRSSADKTRIREILGSFGSPIAVLVLVISCLGILLLPVLGFLIAAAVAWGLAVASLVTGRTLGARLFPGAYAPRWQALLGLAQVWH